LTFPRPHCVSIFSRFLAIFRASHVSRWCLICSWYGISFVCSLYVNCLLSSLNLLLSSSYVITFALYFVLISPVKYFWPHYTTSFKWSFTDVDETVKADDISQPKIHHNENQNQRGQYRIRYSNYKHKKIVCILYKRK
jgi:hypothetical protein